MRYYGTLRSGFSLIELLIAISVISLLITIGALTYQDIQKKGRDAKRQSDLRVIQGALEQYFADNKYYPFSLTSGTSSSFTSGTKTYLNSVPQDPLAGVGTQVNYLYKPIKVVSGVASDCVTTDQNSLCINYCIFANLETTPPAISGCPISATGYNYYITQP